MRPRQSDISRTVATGVKNRPKTIMHAKLGRIVSFKWCQTVAGKQTIKNKGQFRSPQSLYCVAADEPVCYIRPDLDVLGNFKPRQHPGDAKYSHIRHRRTRG